MGGGLPAKKGVEIVERLEAHAASRFHGGTAGMGQRESIGEAGIARMDVVGLAAIDIEAGGAQVPGFQSGDQGVVIHHVAARGVDDNGAFRQVGDVLGIEKISAFKK